MHKLRFLVSRRWVAFALVVVVLAWVAWRLGEWQFDRLEDRKERNAIIERNETAGAGAVADVMAPGAPVAARRRVAASSRPPAPTPSRTPSSCATAPARARPASTSSCPLELADGTSLLVDRGWFATDNRGATTEDVPEPPAGEVTVDRLGAPRRRGRQHRRSPTSPPARSTAREIGEALDREVLGGFVDLRSESPEPADGARARWSCPS